VKGVMRAIWSDLMTRTPVFTTADVAAITGMARSNVSRDLAKLADEGLIVRIRRGLWAITNHPDFSSYEVVPRLFTGEHEGYVSLLSALNLHGMIEQIPRAVHVVTTTQRASLVTPVGEYEFGGQGSYRGTGTFDIASPEKAVFDTLYLSARKGRRFTHLPEIELPVGFSPAAVERWIAKVGLEPLRLGLQDRWSRYAMEAAGR
jgi:DNA-binding transcriptional ArsR family regulator